MHDYIFEFKRPPESQQQLLQQQANLIRQLRTKNCYKESAKGIFYL